MRRKLLAPVAVALFALAGCGGRTVTHTVTAPVRSLAHATSPQDAQRLLYAKRVAEGFGQPPRGDFGIGKPSAIRTATPVLQGYDAVSASAIPFGAPVAPCYISGSWPNCPAVAARHPQHSFTIATWEGASAVCADDEPGDLTPSQAGPWAKRELPKHRNVCVYGDAADYGSINQSLLAWHIPMCTASHTTDCAWRWLADWDGSRVIPPGFAGKQYRNTPSLDYDVFYAYAVTGASPAPKPKPKPKPQPENYQWFCHTRPASGLICGPFDVPIRPDDKDTHGHDVNNERSVLHLYDAARSKPQTGARLAFVAELRDELHGLAIRLYHDSQHRPAARNAALHAYGRVDCLMDRAFDNVVKSWSQCVADGKAHNWTNWLR